MSTTQTYSMGGVLQLGELAGTGIIHSKRLEIVMSTMTVFLNNLDIGSMMKRLDI